MVKNVGIEGGLLNVCDIGYNDRVIKKVIVKYCYVIWKLISIFFGICI